MFRRIGTMPEEERFTRTLIGVLLIVSSLFTWCRWVSLILGILFLISVGTGVCLTCIIYKKLTSRK